jgi:predicted cobalt transporter CbtA
MLASPVADSPKALIKANKSDGCQWTPADGFGRINSKNAKDFN